jgi:hypothetical protein
MNQSLEWRLARTFVRCYALVLIISLVQALFGPLFALLTTANYAGGPDELWKIRAVGISSLVAWLAAVVILWFYSNRIADKLAGTNDSTIEGERVDFPFDAGVGLAGLIFLIEGLKGLAGESAAWYFSKSNTFPYGRPAGVVDVRYLAVSATEAIVGLVLFVGAKSLVQGIMRMRGMPQSTEDEDAA